MTLLLNIKENLRRIYSRYSLYILPVIKFTLTLTSLLMIDSYIGYSSVVSNKFIIVVLSVICSVLPFNLIVLINSLVTILNMYSISPEMALVVVLIYMIMYLVYFRFSSKYGYVMMLMTILCVIKIPFIMPLLVGIAMTPAAIIPMIFGTVTFYIMQYSKAEAVLIFNGVSTKGVERISSFITDLFSNKEMMILIIAFVAAGLIAYGVKRLSIDNSSTIGLIAAGVVEAIIILSAVYVLEIDGIFKLWLVCVFSLLSIILSCILQVFVLAVDYSATEYTQFEDDDYYYYVKAIPKIKVTATDVKVKHINVKRSRR